MGPRHCYLQIFWLSVVSASQNSTEISGWVNDPDGRGTFTILSSCTLTLSLCVYTSIHLNVRPYKQTELRAWIETTKWVFFGILAPELMVFVAWRQYMSARALDRTVKLLQDRKAHEKSLDTEYCLANSWTPLHSFYANMGGFVFDLDELSTQHGGAFTSQIPRLTLTPRGVALLAACGYLPKISKEDILDKNKSDNVSKLLSVLQALWMLAQIVSRLYGKLSVTLLEVNTLAHIVCAIIIYALWWNKPKLINEPTKIRGDWVLPIAAYMFMSSQVSGWRSVRPGILKKDWIDPEFSILAFDPPLSRRTQANSAVPCPRHAKPTLVDVASLSPTHSSSVYHELLSIDVGSWKKRPSMAFSQSGMPLEFMQSIVASRLESSGNLQSNRWSLAAEAMARHPAIAARVICRETLQDDEQVRWFEPVVEELVDVTMGNWATGNLLRAMSGFVMGMVVWSASMAYGGVHATAWHGHFPSRVEALLWRASSICIAGSGFTWILINMLARIFPFFKAYWKRVETLRAHWTSLVGLGSLASLCGLAYLLARIFLVVESFISLRKLPASAFDTMEWTQLVPHL
ncbi:MAG: hypothetical protein LQ344_007065 [Seirophora lacunosa]|nr:MAG: hypothetical protein LQ344_007065 [Seirophora lacunosa]